MDPCVVEVTTENDSPAEKLVKEHNREMLRESIKEQEDSLLNSKKEIIFDQAMKDIYQHIDKNRVDNALSTS